MVLPSHRHHSHSCSSGKNKKKKKKKKETGREKKKVVSHPIQPLSSTSHLLLIFPLSSFSLALSRQQQTL